MQAISTRILIVDDEEKIVDVLKSYLENCGYNVLTAHNGLDALESFKANRPSLIILDLMLPDLSGEEVCQSIRSVSKVPILMLTAKVDEESILKGLNIGADDYVTKPFSPKQIVARVNALLRRSVTDESNVGQAIRVNQDDLVIYPESREIIKAGKAVNLTPNEYNILFTLLKHPKKVFTREELINIVLGEDFSGFDRTIDTHIKNLRQKIETDTKSPRYIVTVHGVGYRFGVNNA